MLAGLFDLAGRVAYVAGGYGGIGEAIAWGLALRRRARGGRRAQRRQGRGARRARCARRATMRSAWRWTRIGGRHPRVGRRAWPRVAAQLDLLVNCVGIQREQRLADVSEEAFDEVVQVNLKAAMFLAQAAARHQVEPCRPAARRRARCTCCRCARSSGMRDRGYSAYCATKGALVMLIKQHAVELCAHGITRQRRRADRRARRDGRATGSTTRQTREQMLKRIPLGRVAEPEDVVGAALFFCSPAAAFVTGQVLYVDGGLTATQ